MLIFSVVQSLKNKGDKELFKAWMVYVKRLQLEVQSLFVTHVRNPDKIGAALFIYSTGVVTKSLQEEFGWGRGDVQSMIAVATVGVLLASPIVGQLMNRLRLRPLIMVSTVAIGLTPREHQVDLLAHHRVGQKGEDRPVTGLELVAVEALAGETLGVVHAHVVTVPRWRRRMIRCGTIRRVLASGSRSSAAGAECTRRW